MRYIETGGNPKHKIFSGDFLIILLSLAFGFLLTGGLYTPQRKPPSFVGTDQTIITQPASGSNPNLHLDTFQIQSCLSNTAVDFLIDNSGSMQFGTKMQELKNALKTFAQGFPPGGAIAMQSYSETVVDRVPFSLFKDSKSTFLSQVDAMKPETATHSKDAFLVAKNSLQQGKAKFPNHNFALIFISDGIPESKNENSVCPGGQNSPFCAPYPSSTFPKACRCYDVNQDPRDIATEIKNSGVRIFTISFVDNTEAKFNDKLQELMRAVATDPSDYYPAPIDTQLTDIINRISTKICSSP